MANEIERKIVRPTCDSKVRANLLIFSVILFILVGCFISKKNISGLILERKKEIVTVSLGTKQGVKVGDILIVFRQKEAVFHPKTKKLIKERMQKVAQLEITSAGEKASEAMVMRRWMSIKVGDFVEPLTSEKAVIHEWWNVKSKPVRRFGNSTVSGVLATDEVWSGEVTVTGDVVVPYGYTLTIRPGTRIIFKANADDRYSGKDLNRCELIVKGQLDAQGSKNKMIEFTTSGHRFQPNDPSLPHWYGIILYNYNDELKSVIRFSRINHAAIGIDLHNSSSVLISNNEIYFNRDIGIQCYMSSPEIRDNVIRSSNLGVECGDKSAPIIVGNRVTRCNEAIHTNGSANPTVLRNTITDSGVGVVCRTDAKVMLLGNIITRNNIGISCIDNAQAKLKQNQIIGNKRYGILVGGNGILEMANGNNSIYDNQQYDFYNETTKKVDATRNHWGIYDAAVIDYKIYDNEEDRNAGEVIFQPFQLSFVELPVDDNIFGMKLAPLEIDTNDKISLEQEKRTSRRKVEAFSKLQIDDKISQRKTTIEDDILTDKTVLVEDREILRQSLRSKPQTEEIESGRNLAKPNETQKMGVVIEDTFPVDIPRTIVGKDGAEMVLIPPGEFLMGSPDTEGNEDEHPQHRVYVKAFYIDQHEVTNAQYRQFIEETGHREPDFWGNPYLSRPQQPIVGVSWHDAVGYAKWAQKRLPTEAEWEKAARGGLEGKQYPWGDSFPNVSGQYKANYYIEGNSAADGYQYTAPVGSYLPNGYKLYDMVGNVSEWVADWYNEIYYLSSPKQNPRGPQNGRYRVIRGGAWDVFAYDLRCANRDVGNPNRRYVHVGFRCAKNVTP